MNRKMLVAVLALFTIGAIVVSRDSAAQATPQRIEIVARRFGFTPSEVTLKKGVPVVLVLTSADVNHGLKVQELNLVLKANKGESKELQFTPAVAGTFAGQCSVFCGTGHGSMKMVFHVTE